MLDRRSRHRIHGMLADCVLIELWLAEEFDIDDDVTYAELSDAFSRIQARMLVVQSLLWPSDEHFPEADEADGDFHEESHGAANHGSEPKS